MALEKQLKKHKRAFKKARKRPGGPRANVRAKRNSLASIKARQRGAIARREGAEAALGSRILSMSRLAQRRVAKKTNVRPGMQQRLRLARARPHQPDLRLHRLPAQPASWLVPPLP